MVHSCCVSQKTSGAYRVIEMAEGIKDFKSFCGYYLTQTTSLQWSHIKSMKVEKAIPDSLFVKYSFSCQDFTRIIVNTRPADANCIESFETAGTREVSTTANVVSDVNRNSDSATVTPNLKKLENESTVSAAKKERYVLDG